LQLGQGTGDRRQGIGEQRAWSEVGCGKLYGSGVSVQDYSRPPLHQSSNHRYSTLHRYLCYNTVRAFFF